MRHKNSRGHALLRTLIFGAALQAGAAHAEDMELATAKNSWSTSSHLGYAIADRSSTGFTQVGGSLVFLDIVRPVSQSVELGLRSTAQGAHNGPDEFYRLGAGPLLTYKLSKAWSVQAALNFFNETGLGSQQKETYTSRGGELQVGWERQWTCSRRVQVAAGGFSSFHQGGVSATTAGATLASRYVNASSPGPSVNSGLSHGLEVAVRLSL